MQPRQRSDNLPAMKKRALQLYGILMLSLPFFLFDSPALAQPLHQPHAGELLAGLKRLGVVGSVLYVAAHPDDENSRLLAYLVGEKGLAATYLSLTRGDGGQNLLGTEQDELLGLLRTHELLAARKIDGAEQLFTRARDLGYTKRAEEALDLWGRQAVLADVVQAIRRVRPDVVITRFNTLPPNHGHHTASALLAAEAFQIAADPGQFADQIQLFPAFQPQRLLHNVPNFNLPEHADMSAYLQLDVGHYDPLRGRSWTEIAAQSRSQHKSQGFGVAPERGPSLEYFAHLGGSKPQKDPLDGLDFTWKRFPGGEKVQTAVEAAQKIFDPQHPERTIPALWKVHAAIQALPEQNPWKVRKLLETETLVLACAGIVLDVRAIEPVATPGDLLQLQVIALNRSTAAAKILHVELADGVTQLNAEMKANQPVVQTHALKLPANAVITTPYWLRTPTELGLDQVEDLAKVGLPEDQPALLARFVLEVGGHPLTTLRTIRNVWVDPVKGELSRPFEVAPPLMATLEREVFVLTNGQPLTLSVKVEAARDVQRAQVRLELPAGWKSPEPALVTLGKGKEMVVHFVVTAPKTFVDKQPFRVLTVVEGKTESWNQRTVRYDHVPPLTVRQPSQGTLVPLEINLGVKHLGYIPGPGDRVAESLQAVGYEVTQLPLDKLASEPLERFEAILVGIRAFNQFPQLASQREKLLKYVENGGRLVVQYQTNSRIAALSIPIGPYPLEISRDRVTDERAEMQPLDPNDPLLTTPNRLTARDFQDWVQERGLYFASKWDAHYRPVLAMHDVGEQPLKGGLLVAKYGKGSFVYTGLAFFRQLPAGVPGAYRLLANLLSQ